MIGTDILLESHHQDSLDDLLGLGVLEELDFHFARHMAQISPELVAPEVLLGLAFASRAVGLGHVCAELKLLSRARPMDREGRPVDLTLPDYPHWLALLKNSKLVASTDSATLRTPLVLDFKNGRLYLTRYWLYQHTLLTEISARATRFEQVNGPLLAVGLKRYFGPGSVRENRQRLAAMIAVMRNFSVISGGPGTGKTTTVTRILALLLEQAMDKGMAMPKIMLLAPTGKAAARLGETIKIQKRKLNQCQALLEHIPEQGATIHRVMGWLPDRPTRFDRNENDPLPADVVLVDEASMVDVGLLAKLVRAVPSHARLILLGDKDQLASVEAGAILGDITGARQKEVNVYSHDLANRVASLTGESIATQKSAPVQTGIWDSIVHLTHSYRFSEKSGIGLLARAIQRGQGANVIKVLRRDRDCHEQALFEGRDVSHVPLQDRALAEAKLNSFIEASFRPYLEASNAVDALHFFDRARILCAHRHGAMGVESLNQHAERLLGELKLINPRDPFYLGRPVMVIRNDYQFNLFNGDIGIILKEPETGRPMVYFPTREGEPRKLPPGHLPPHETVYAMTVHKSQGSEFNHVALLLPTEISRIVTRELIYTAITRAKYKVTLFGDEEVLIAGIKVRITRASGLRDALWGCKKTDGSAFELPEKDAPNGWQQLELF